MLAGIFSALTFPLPQASTMAPKTDALYDFIYWVSVFTLTPTVLAMLYFGWKYRASKHDPDAKTPYIPGNHVFEWTVSVVLSIVFVVIFVWGLAGYNEIYDVPDNAYGINVIGQQWLWQFQYANGKMSNDLVVPRGQPIKLVMTSKDVIHDFFVPDFRLKKDVVPGMYTTLWFNAPQVGEHDVFCAQYCGTGHSNMLAKVVVMEPEQFKIWLRGGNPNKINLADLGEHLFKQRNCIACHSVNGTNGIGPTLKGVFGKAITLSDGSQVRADENYIRDSILNPGAAIVKGFSPIMPTFKGLLSEEDLNSLVAYIKSLKE